MSIHLLFFSFFFLSYNSHYLCSHWVNYSFLISGLTVTLTLSPFRLNDLAVGFNIKEMIITCWAFFCSGNIYINNFFFGVCVCIYLFRFLALKNLATVFLQQGSSHYESALRCYLQAVEIDTKDSVVWNQLGTLACSMGLLSISRWAFEQGLLCSPNNCKHLFISFTI